jgi:putative transposase
MRDLVRFIQNARKEAGLEVSDRINLVVESASGDLQAVLTKYEQMIMSETLAVSLNEQKADEHSTNVRIEGAFPVFERVFQQYGLPRAIRSDNGVPFASANGLFGLTKLSVWWLRLGIDIERIKPGHPEQNGRHERMHLTLKKATASPSADSFLEQQDRFESFVEEFNCERPHQALEMKFPSEIYTPSDRVYRGIGRLDYPMHHKVITVTHCGRICFKSLKISFSHTLAGQDVGIRQVEDKVWQVSFMDYDLGFFDEESGQFEPGTNPFGSKVLPVSPV